MISASKCFRRPDEPVAHSLGNMEGHGTQSKHSRPSIIPLINLSRLLDWPGSSDRGQCALIDGALGSGSNVFTCAIAAVGKTETGQLIPVVNTLHA